VNRYERFIEYHEQQGRDFPCSASQFYTRAEDFAREYVITCEESITTDELIDELCTQGIGVNWKED
jgi:hypothetical protein